MRQAIHENNFQSPLSTHLFVERFVADLDQIKPSSKEKGSKQPSPQWISLPAGLAKINVDATISENSNWVAIAAVARNEDGVYLGASVVVTEGTNNLETLEALACREGLFLASDLSLRRYRLASDCANVIRSVFLALTASPPTHPFFSFAPLLSLGSAGLAAAVTAPRPARDLNDRNNLWPLGAPPSPNACAILALATYGRSECPPSPNAAAHAVLTPSETHLSGSALCGGDGASPRSSTASDSLIDSREDMYQYHYHRQCK
ncbi:hypothetical protein U9M48_001805 [Paspalum notatum var. saurae]|uniref:RNase H type-1 domain-containing protein n=1 Tax=Paspalum notatum var. saurae TaxID=547442 RepID=A0AAQ3PMN3_PASNO